MANRESLLYERAVIPILMSGWDLEATGIGEGMGMTRDRTTQISYRALTHFDVPAWARLYQEVALVDDLGGSYEVDDLAERLRQPSFDARRDSLAAFTPQGELVGFAVVHALPSAGKRHAVTLPGGVHPHYRGRGVGRHLWTWQERRGAELHQQLFPTIPGLLLTDLYPERAAQSARLFDHLRLQPEIWVFQMERTLSHEPAVPDPPELDGLRILAVDRARDSERVRKAHNAAFQDHGESTALTADFWETRWGSRRFRADLSYVAVDPAGDVAAYVLSYDRDTVSDLGQIGTVRGYRGRGLASALISRSLHASWKAGFPAAELHVRTTNESGAVHLYERLGFVVTKRMVRYSREIPVMNIR